MGSNIYKTEATNNRAALYTEVAETDTHSTAYISNAGGIGGCWDVYTYGTT
jgi:hypothetical protein